MALSLARASARFAAGDGRRFAQGLRAGMCGATARSRGAISEGALDICAVVEAGTPNDGDGLAECAGGGHRKRGEVATDARGNLPKAHKTGQRVDEGCRQSQGSRTASERGSTRRKAARGAGGAQKSAPHSEREI